MTELAELVGWRVRRLDGPAEGLFCLTLRGSRQGAVLLLSTDGPVDWGIVDERPRGQPADAFVQLLRKHFGNGRLDTLTIDEEGLSLRARKGTHEATLALRRSGELSVLVEGRALATRTGAAARPDRPETLEALRAHGKEMLARRAGGDLEARRTSLRRALRRRIGKLERRLHKIAQDRARVGEVDGLRTRASAILAQLSRLPEDAEVVEVTDWSADPPEPIRIPIRAGRTPKDEADSLFRRARKLERGAEIARERAAITEAEIEALGGLRSRAESADGPELEALAREIGRRGLKPAPKRRDGSARRLPYHVFRGAGDRPIHVGRTARDNDTLTLGAKPWDHWLHARGVPGSHVVVPLSRGEDCPAELLIDAAHLAAHYSQLRGEDRVEVTHVPRRYVRKPRGFAAGAVRVEREKTLLLRLEPARLSRLLGSGDPA